MLTELRAFEDLGLKIKLTTLIIALFCPLLVLYFSYLYLLNGNITVDTGGSCIQHLYLYFVYFCFGVQYFHDKNR